MEGNRHVCTHLAGHLLDCKLEYRSLLFCHTKPGRGDTGAPAPNLRDPTDRHRQQKLSEAETENSAVSEVLRYLEGRASACRTT